MSLLLRPEVPQEQIQTLGLVSAMAVRESIAGLTSPESRAVVAVKWPNDIIVLNRDASNEGRFCKICGISSEQKGGAVCVGIGVNVFRTGGIANASFSDARNIGAYLEDIMRGGCEVSVSSVRDAVLDSFMKKYDKWQACSFDALREEYEDCLAFKGSAVSIANSDSTDSGAAEPFRCEIFGVDEAGRLIVRDCLTNETKEIVSGTITIVE